MVKRGNRRWSSWVGHEDSGWSSRSRRRHGREIRLLTEDLLGGPSDDFALMTRTGEFDRAGLA